MQQLINENFQALGSFDFVSANKILNKIQRLNSQAGPVLQVLIKCEGSYTSLEYLKNNKIFSRRTTPNYTELSTLVNSLHKPQQSTDNGEQLDIEDFRENLRHFIEIRQSQISIYKSILTDFSSIDGSEKIVDELERVRDDAEGYQLSEKLGPLGVGVECELTILKYLFMARKAIVTYNFKDSAIFLYTVKSKLSYWREVCSQKAYLEKKSSNRNEESTSAFSAISSFLSLSSEKSKRNDSPSNIQWLEKFLSSLTSRMTLYFMHVLVERETVMGGDIKSLWRRVDVDHHGNIRNFRKRSGAISVLLIYEVDEVDDDVPFRLQGYVGSGVPYENQTELKNPFTCIYCSPLEEPKSHFQNIETIMKTKDPKKETPFHRNKPIYFSDKSSYYFIRIDEFVSLVIIFDKPSDNNTSDFIMDLANKLSGFEVLNSLSN